MMRLNVPNGAHGSRPCQLHRPQLQHLVVGRRPIRVRTPRAARRRENPSALRHAPDLALLVARGQALGADDRDGHRGVGVIAADERGAGEGEGRKGTRATFMGRSGGMSRRSEGEAAGSSISSRGARGRARERVAIAARRQVVDFILESLVRSRGDGIIWSRGDFCSERRDLL